MNPDLLKALIENAVKAGFDAAAGSGVPMWLAGVIGTALVGTVTALFGLLVKTARDYAEKIEALLSSQQAREDDRDDRCAAKHVVAIADERKRYDERLERSRKAKDAAREQHDRYKQEVERLERDRVIELAEIAKQATAMLDVAVAQLERFQKEG